MSDVKLERGSVKVEGQLKVDGTDIHLKAESRQDPNNNKRYRRALVHGSNDELIVNFANDYNGVKINARQESGIYLNGPTYVKNINLLETIQFLLAERERLYSAVNQLERKAGVALTPAALPETDITHRRFKIPQRFRVDVRL